MAEHEPSELGSEESFNNGAARGVRAAPFVAVTIALLAASFELGIDGRMPWLFWPMLLDSIPFFKDFFRQRPQFVILIYAGQFFFPLIGIALGVLAMRRGDRLARWLGAVAALTCLLVLIEYVPLSIRGIKVGATPRASINVVLRHERRFEPDGKSPERLKVHFFVSGGQSRVTSGRFA
ncbi:MAG TPA: hypothetical protein VG055_29425 [Planctomycetaceae bacterium]|jgi:hypothetical protein|nr:hypothetical protein [Planctomycetaceae bacterium]